jgi:hypothetical protein
MPAGALVMNDTREVVRSWRARHTGGVFHHAHDDHFTPRNVENAHPTASRAALGGDAAPG